MVSARSGHKLTNPSNSDLYCVINVTLLPFCRRPAHGQRRPRRGEQATGTDARHHGAARSTGERLALAALLQP